MLTVGQDFRSIWAVWYCLKVSLEVAIKSVAKVGIISKAFLLQNVNTSKAQGWSMGFLRHHPLSLHDLSTWSFLSIMLASKMIVQAPKDAWPQKVPDEICITVSNLTWEVMRCKLSVSLIGSTKVCPQSRGWVFNLCIFIGWSCNYILKSLLWEINNV